MQRKGQAMSTEKVARLRRLRHPPQRVDDPQAVRGRDDHMLRGELRQRPERRLGGRGWLRCPLTVTRGERQRKSREETDGKAHGWLVEDA